MRARVVSGPFKGLEGQLESPARPGRAMVRIRALGLETVLELDASLVDRLEEESPEPSCSDRPGPLSTSTHN